MSFTVAVSSKHRKREIGTEVLYCYDYRDATSSAGMRAKNCSPSGFRPNPFSAILLILDRKISSKVPKYKKAVLQCIKYLSQFGYSEEQIYLLLSCCPCEGRISGIVDVPNAVCTLAIPLAIFDRDVRPPKTLAALAAGVRVVEKDVCISELGGAVPFDPRLEES